MWTNTRGNCVVILLIGVSLVQSKTLPSYFKLCSRRDPNYNACAVEHARIAIPELVKGDPEFGLPSMLPFKIPEIVYKTKELELTLKNLEVYGLEKAEAKDIKMDFKTLKETVNFVIPEMEIKGEYDVKGQILVVPINGKGPLSLIVDNLSTYYSAQIVIEERDGEKYRKTTDVHLKYVPEKVTFKLENLFNDAALSEQMNESLNQNWKEVNNELENVITESIQKIVEPIVNSLLSQVPYDNIYGL